MITLNLAPRYVPKPPGRPLGSRNTGRTSEQQKAQAAIDRRNWYVANRDKVLAASKKLRLENPPEHFRIRLKSNYGIDVETYARMLHSQGFSCAICREVLAMDKRTHVDHNHATGKVRGVLCQDCNHTIGSARERVDVLRSAIEYLGGRQVK